MFADAKQTMWRLERPFVLPVGITCAPAAIPVLPAATWMPFDGVQADRQMMPGVVPG